MNDPLSQQAVCALLVSNPILLPSLTGLSFWLQVFVGNVRLHGSRFMRKCFPK